MIAPSGINNKYQFQRPTIREPGSGILLYREVNIQSTSFSGISINVSEIEYSLNENQTFANPESIFEGWKPGTIFYSPTYLDKDKFATLFLFESLFNGIVFPNSSDLAKTTISKYG